MTNPADDVFVVGEVCLAVLAAVDLGGVEVHVVREPHAGGCGLCARRIC